MLPPFYQKTIYNDNNGAEDKRGRRVRRMSRIIWCRGFPTQWLIVAGYYELNRENAGAHRNEQTAVQRVRLLLVPAAIQVAAENYK